MPKVRTIQALRQELRIREGELSKLAAQRASLAKRLAMVERKIAAIGGEAPPVQRRRRKKAARRMKVARGRAVSNVQRERKGQTLAASIAQVLGRAKAPMRVKDITPAVKAAGYRSKSKDFYGFVATTLRDRTKFRRVGRGNYTLAR